MDSQVYIINNVAFTSYTEVTPQDIYVLVPKPQDLSNIISRNINNDSVNISLFTIGGTFKTNVANAATNYLVTISANALPGAYEKIRINAPSEPTINGVSAGKIPGAEFQANTDIDLVIYTEDLTDIKYYFLER